MTCKPRGGACASRCLSRPRKPLTRRAASHRVAVLSAVAATAPHARVDYLRMIDDLHAWLSARSGGEVNCADLDAFYAQFPHHDCRQGGGRGSGIKQAILRYGAQRLQWLDPEPSTGGEARIALPPPATVLRLGAEDGELDEALAAEFVPC